MSEQDAVKDEVLDTVREPNMGVVVRRVLRHGYEEDTKLLKVYGTRENRHMALDGSGPVDTERMVKLAEFEPQTATEVLFGLAEAHGYDLEGK